MGDVEPAPQVEALFAELAGASADERAAALRQLNDPGLAAAVARLLAAHDEVSESGDGFLGDIRSAPVKALLKAGETPAPDRIGRYPVIRRLGHGGMGVVCLARDPLLDRPVAIKLLSPHLGGSADAVRRLAAEARILSALDHPNIAAVHEIAETPDGQSFIVMAYYEGETLRERLDRGPLSVDEALSVGIQLAEGLGAAHRAGIVHRDVKPENVVLTGEGRVVILDFGIAQAASASLVTGGMMRGTAAYMSPEQSRGEKTDPRTDVWSTGVVLHEILTGSRPFPGDGLALVNAIREEPPAPLAPGRSGIPPALSEVVKTCLAKSPALRMRSGGELAVALTAIRDGRNLGTRTRVRFAALAGIGLTALAATTAYLARPGESARAVPTAAIAAAAPGIAVLPFEVRGEEHQIWREGMVDVLAANLDGVEGLRGIDSRTVLALWASRVGSGSSADLASALSVASEAGARYAVLGSIVPFERDLRIAVSVYPVRGVAALASFSVDGPADSLLSLVDQITIKVLAAAWQGRLPSAEINLGRITTLSLPALKSFLNGERLLRQGNYAEAVAQYREAVVADSTFAIGYYRLGLAQVWIGETEDSLFAWQRAFREAVRLSDRLPERERMLVRLALESQVSGPHNVLATSALAERAVARYPDEADAWYFLGEIYYHAGDQLLVPLWAADSAFRHALALDPAMAMLYEHMFENELNVSRDSSRARELLGGYSRVTAPYRVRRLELAFDLAFGDSATRHAAIAQFGTLPEGERMATIWSFRNLRYGDVLQSVLGDYPRWQTLDSRLAAERLLQMAVDHGQLLQVARHLGAPQLLGAHGALHAYRARLGQLAPPDTVLRAALGMPPAGAELPLGSAGFQVVVAGAVAAEEGRWADHESALARLNVMVQLARERADSASARFIEGSRTALRGYGLSLRGERDRALSLLVSGQQDATGGESISGDAWNAIIRWWIGDLLVQEGRLSEAARYFGSIRNDPFAAERLAPILEQLGQPEQARDAYTLVSEAWREGDPAMQRRAAAARASVVRLAQAQAQAQDAHGD